MPKRKIMYPYRKGYRRELMYPSKWGNLLLPTHGSGPRCRVEHNLSDEGPWSTLQIMNVDEDRDPVEVEEYTCAMPRYYAVPLILINKRLAFVEASYRPDGTPLALPASHPTPTATSINPNDDNDHGGGGEDGRGVAMVTQRDLREYSYLWRLRTGFLQAIFDMNHQRRLDERWRYDPIHGFMHRLYRRYGHDLYQRAAYWRDEINAARVPYATPDIADMDWDAHVLEDMAAGARINAFLWNRVSQGYPRVVKDEPPQEGWRAWRRSAAEADRAAREQKPALFRTPGCSPVRELGAVPDQQTQTQSQSQSPRCARHDIERADASARHAPPAAAAAATESTSASAAAVAAAGGCCAGTVNGRDDDVDTIDSMTHEEVLAVALDGPQPTQVWQLPFPASEQLSKAASQGTPSTSRRGRRRPDQVLLDFDVPKEMRLTVIHCTFSHVDDVGEDPKRDLKVIYASRVS